MPMRVIAGQVYAADRRLIAQPIPASAGSSLAARTSIVERMALAEQKVLSPALSSRQGKEDRDDGKGCNR
jgi:hypothetical protein